MAIQFCSLKEACAKLGKTEDEIKTLVRDGKLREFRDRGQLFFKGDEVDRLATELGSPPGETIRLDDSVAGASKAGGTTLGGSAVGGSGIGEGILGDSSIGASHAGTPAGAKSKAGSTAGGILAPAGGAPAGLSDSGVGLSGSGSGEIRLEGEPSGKDKGKDALGGSGVGLGGSSVGLSGSDMLALDEAEEPGKGGSRAGSKEDTVISSVGISVFDDDEIRIDVDPLGKTQVAPSVEDQISLEGVGSGSGLLDLTREADDTSLGAELLDEIYPGEEESTVQEDMPTEVVPSMAVGMPSREEAPAFAAAPGAWVPAAAVPVAPDPAAAGFMGVMVIGLIMLGLTGTILAGAIQGVAPSFLSTLYGQWLWVTLGSIGVTAAVLLIGWFMGKSAVTRKSQPARAAAPEAAPSEGKGKE